MVFFYVSGCLFLLQILVDGSGGLLAGAHSQNDGCSAGNGVAACEDALTGGHLILVDDQAALPVGLQTGSGGTDQGVGAGAQTHDDGIHIQDELTALDLDGTAATGSVRLTQFHADALHAADTAVLVADDLHSENFQ